MTGDALLTGGEWCFIRKLCHVAAFSIGNGRAGARTCGSGQAGVSGTMGVLGWIGRFVVVGCRINGLRIQLPYRRSIPPTLLAESSLLLIILQPFPPTSRTQPAYDLETGHIVVVRRTLSSSLLFFFSFDLTFLPSPSPPAPTLIHRSFELLRRRLRFCVIGITSASCSQQR